MCYLLCPLSSRISTLQTPYLRSVQLFASFFCIWAARHNSGKSTKPNPSGTWYYLIVYGTYLLSSFSCSWKNYSKTFPLLPSTAPGFSTLCRCPSCLPLGESRASGQVSHNASLSLHQLIFAHLHSYLLPSCLGARPFPSSVQDWSSCMGVGSLLLFLGPRSSQHRLLQWDLSISVYLFANWANIFLPSLSPLGHLPFFPFPMFNLASVSAL